MLVPLENYKRVNKVKANKRICKKINTMDPAILQRYSFAQLNDNIKPHQNGFRKTVELLG